MIKPTLVPPEQIARAIVSFEMVECLPQKMRLTKTSCIKNWQLAKASKTGNIEEFGGIYRARTRSILQNSLCVDCHVGEARHKGDPDPSWYCECGSLKLRGECVRESYLKLVDKADKLKAKESKIVPNTRQKRLRVCARCGLRFLSRSATLCHTCVKNKIRETKVARLAENPEETRCKNCGTIYIKTHVRQQYCSSKCRLEVYNYNRRELEKNGTANMRENRSDISSGDRRADGNLSDGQGS